MVNTHLAIESLKRQATVFHNCLCVFPDRPRKTIWHLLYPPNFLMVQPSYVCMHTRLPLPLEQQAHPCTAFLCICGDVENNGILHTLWHFTLKTLHLLSKTHVNVLEMYLCTQLRLLCYMRLFSRIGCGHRGLPSSHSTYFNPTRSCKCLPATIYFAMRRFGRKSSPKMAIAPRAAHMRPKHQRILRQVLCCSFFFSCSIFFSFSSVP